MRENTAERRLELLKHEENGLLKSEVVKVLADKYGVSAVLRRV